MSGQSDEVSLASAEREGEVHAPPLAFRSGGHLAAAGEGPLGHPGQPVAGGRRARMNAGAVVVYVQLDLFRAPSRYCLDAGLWAACVRTLLSTSCRVRCTVSPATAGNAAGSPSTRKSIRPPRPPGAPQRATAARRRRSSPQSALLAGATMAYGRLSEEAQAASQRFRSVSHGQGEERPDPRRVLHREPRVEVRRDPR